MSTKKIALRPSGRFHPSSIFNTRCTSLLPTNSQCLW